MLLHLAIRSDIFGGVVLYSSSAIVVSSQQCPTVKSNLWCYRYTRQRGARQGSSILQIYLRTVYTDRTSPLIMRAQYSLRGSHYIVQTSQPVHPAFAASSLLRAWLEYFICWIFCQSVLSPLVRVLDHLVVGGPGSYHHPCHCLEELSFYFDTKCAAACQSWADLFVITFHFLS